MAKILIIDDNKAASAFLTLVLLRHQHQVVRSREVAETTARSRDFTPDLILINHAFKNNSGWQVFNDLKQMACNLPVMVYVLKDLTIGNADWIDRAVDAAIKESRKDPPLRCRREAS
ncbi:hypothetical protein JCM12296A_59030 [Desulfosarcina cetonica]|uniref:response regulator n=1 Tax=Desulfosarcina cetonica TaxID=90730 RepID=UPI0006CF6533|nr:response regulator [Desulfosarcina cetonica]